MGRRARVLHLRGAGAPCLACNAPADGAVPRMPEGFGAEVDEDGWRH
jgi:hypothetical protein